MKTAKIVLRLVLSFNELLRCKGGGVNRKSGAIVQRACR